MKYGSACHIPELGGELAVPARPGQVFDVHGVDVLEERLFAAGAVGRRTVHAELTLGALKKTCTATTNFVRLLCITAV
jgi:hypothetical protein